MRYGSVMVFRSLLWVLLVANAMVLLGHLWPEGAPPFAGSVTLGFLVVNLLLLVGLLRRKATR